MNILLRTELSVTQGLLIYWSPALFAIIYFSVWTYRNSKLKKGIFLTNGSNREDNIQLAYIHLSGRLLRVDREEAGEKLKYMHESFRRYFPSDYSKFSDTLRFSMNHPIQINSVGLWMYRNLTQPERIQAIDFLVGLSIIDGTINKYERALLEEIYKVLGISPKEFETILGVYEKKYEDQRKQEQQTTKRKSKSTIQLCYKIIGVSEFASFDEVKKAYRKLVKLHHPDRFATQGIEQQQLAQERFLEIQKAYEVIEQSSRTL